MTQLQRFQSTLSKSEFDGALITSELNQRYLSDFAYTDGYILITPHSAYLLADFRYIESAKKQVKGLEVIMPAGAMTDALLETINKEKLSRIAIEESSLSYKEYLTLTDKLGISLLQGASEMLSTQRAVKLPYEIERIQRAQTITDAAFSHILKYINSNITETDIALELEFFMRKQGAEAIAFDTIAVSGAASSLPHGVPSPIKLCSGFLTMDFGAKYMGYCSDMTRTVVIGKADREIKKIYTTVLSAQKNALDGICEGMSCRDADELARSVIREAGYGAAFGHSLGHGVGMYIHESPSLSPRASEGSCLVCGNVVTVEPGIYLEGKFGCRIEDMIAITSDGSIYNFTNSPKELIEI